MHGMIRRIKARLGALKSQESGISLPLVAISMVALIGMVAFAVDVGALYQERRELQSGADAAALAIAEDCARSITCNDADALVTGDAYSDSNAGDLASAIDAIDLDTTAKTVNVKTITETATGGSIFKPFFAQVVGFDGTEVHAEAEAAWGYLSGGISTIPLIISACEWERETNSGQPYDPANPDDGGLHPVEGPYDPAGISLLKFHTGNHNADPCAAVAGQDTDGDGTLHGGFGWLLDPDGDCTVEVDSGSWVPTDPGASPTTGCSPAEFRDEVLGKIVGIPYFNDDNDLSGANGEYHVQNYAAFLVTGYNFGGQYKEPSPAPCNGDVRCLEGFFIDKTWTHGDLGGTSGVIVVKFTK